MAILVPQQNLPFDLTKIGTTPQKASHSTMSLSSKRWRSVADRFAKFSEDIVTEGYFCKRNPQRLASLSDYQFCSDRLKYCTAFGQHLQRLPTERQIYGQFGLYGTSSVLELLAMSQSAKQFVEHAAIHSPRINQDWAIEYLKIWNFISLIVNDLSNLGASKFWDETRTTLRSCHLLRSIAASRNILTASASYFRQSAIQVDPEVSNQFTDVIEPDNIQKVADILYSNLKIARIESNAAGSGTTFQFAVDAEEVPETWQDWLFVWSSVIVAIVRAHRATLISNQQMYSICTGEDIDVIKEVLTDRNQFDDDRYRIFALWALDHLATITHEREQDFRGLGQLSLGSADREWLAKQISQTANRLLNSEALLRDVHAPYQIFFHNKRIGERFRDDYYVIPVVPILMDLTAKYKPEWLFKQSSREILQQWLNACDRLDNGGHLGLLPLQIGNYNGTVNALYYHAASLKIAAALTVRTKYVCLRIIWEYLKDHARKSVVALIAILTIVISLALIAKGDSSSMLIGFILGMLTEIIGMIIDAIKKRHWRSDD